MPRLSPYRILLPALLLLPLAANAADDWPFASQLAAPARITSQDARTTLAASSITVNTSHAQPWPGLTLTAPAPLWNFSSASALSADIHNPGTTPLTVNLRIDNAGADGTNNCITRNIAIPPGQTRTLRALLGRTDIRLFGMRGYPPEAYSGIDPSKITAILFFLNRPTADHQFEITNLRLEPATPVPARFFPLIDTFGQYLHRDWPGKTHSLEEMQSHRDQEAKDLAAHPAPNSWDRFGGIQDGPALEATGFFRVARHEGKWWLIDPDGHLFFSQGIDCVQELDATPIDERTDWFQDFPGNRPEFTPFLSKPFALHGHYAGKNPQSFSFTAANLLRKYGTDWRKTAADIAHQRLHSWGLNTIGNWSDLALCRLDKTPYVRNLSTTDNQAQMIAGSSGYWGKFPDPFAPSFAASITRRATQQAAQTAADPWCIGYFVDNEMSWGDELSLALATLQSPADQPAKQTFVADLKSKYTTVENLNTAWSTKYPSWDSLLASREPPDKSRARPDLEAFYTRLAQAYFTTVKQALAQAAPHQLYLGCRFAGSNPLAIRAAASSCDVISFNLYQHDVAGFKLPTGLDRPVIIGEFHFGALDRGMLHTGLVPTDSQSARAQAYTTYVQSALTHPNIVGCHWFKYCDQPTTGRTYDEENYQIGFLDEADTPYPETIAASRQLAIDLYRLRLAK